MVISTSVNAHVHLRVDIHVEQTEDFNDSR